VGTGRFLGASDIGDLQVQSIWGITDPLTSGTVYSDLRASMKPLEMTQIGTPPTATRTVACPSTATAAQCASTNGWVVDLKDSGERVNVGMQLILGTLVVASNVPQDTACTSGGHSWISYLNFSTGLAVASSPNQVVSQYMADSLIVGLGVVGLAPPAGMSNPNYVGLIQTGGGSGFQKSIPVGTPNPVGKRVSWREIPQ
jgi:Tfp pilus tip-associated adhesin PilY1